MKKLYIIICSVLTLFASCNSDQPQTTAGDSQNTESSIYERITATYLQKQQEQPSPAKASFWNWLKNIAAADAKAVAVYVAKHGTNSDWKEALLAGATASAIEALSGDNSKKVVQDATGLKPYQTLVLSDIQQIKTAAFERNVMDNLGYYHYVLVNEVLKDSTLLTIPQSEVSAVLYDKIYQEAKQLGLDASYEKEIAVELVNKINQVEDDESDAYYEHLYLFKNPTDVMLFKPIAKLYTSTFLSLNNKALFTAYSKEMETAVLEDSTLSQQVKDVLLLEMATYRFGNTYYFSNF